MEKIHWIAAEARVAQLTEDLLDRWLEVLVEVQVQAAANGYQQVVHAPQLCSQGILVIAPGPN